MIAIVHTGKLTAAAKALHISQSAASRALKTLECKVGVPLFQRQRDGLHTTEAVPCSRRLPPAVCLSCDDIDLYRCPQGQRCDRDRRTRWIGSVEVTPIHRIHGSKICHVSKINTDACDVGKRFAGRA
jgi:hypothetical protein